MSTYQVKVWPAYPMPPGHPLGQINKKDQFTKLKGSVRAGPSASQKKGFKK
jgi:hypothetical protein